MIASYNARYRNFHHLWYDAPGCGTDDLHVGGFRPQRLSPEGFVAGPTSIRFDLSGFSPAAPLALVMGSFRRGATPLPFANGRSVGLATDPFLLLTLSHPTAFAAPLDARGAGSTTPTPIALPPRLLVYFAAVSLKPAAPVFGDFTDVVQVCVR